MNKKIKSWSFRLFLLLILVVSSTCTYDNDNPLAPYDGSRPLKILRVTKSMNPDIQWIGGRVAAIGVNQGNVAALDSTLIYIRTVDDNTIGSFASYPDDVDITRIQQYAGDFQDSLRDETQYTFWLAEKNALEGQLDSTQLNEFNFADTSFVMSVLLKGTAGGEKNAQGNLLVTISITRDQKMLTDDYYIDWQPADIPFRQLAIRTKSIGGYTDLLWHIITPDSLEDNIYPPVTIGIAPSGTEEAIPWPETRFEEDKVHFLWMSNSDWTVNNFSPSAKGYAWYRIIPFK